jgi:FkbM family methyltransferase
MGLFRKKKHQAISLPTGAVPVPASVKFRGCTFRMPDHWVITKQLLDGKDYEPWVLDYFLQTLEPGMTVLDVGASWGAFALPAARKIGPSGQVIAVEMSPGNGRVILESAKANAVDNIRLILVGVSDTLGTAFLRRQTMHNNHQLEPSGDGVPANLDDFDIAPVVPLDLLRAEFGKVDVMKIDIEGMEYRAFMGAKAFMAEQKPITFLEYSPRFQAETSRAEGSALLSFFLDMGYGVEILHRKKKREAVKAATPAEVIAKIDAAWTRHVEDDKGTHLDLCLKARS